uniref:Uncharacterized protein n=1 Tax=Kalanchoe fedtschenkoi TaxID=63787 RepID=A0A7N0ZR66_KALFE
MQHLVCHADRNQPSTNTHRPPEPLWCATAQCLKVLKVEEDFMEKKQQFKCAIIFNF